ncbi:MAG: PVC-type heme-binding CxxCH protein [Prosthecobacter sp.]|uniref:PVC-type heme-binding CxxCH protein n=1 Tax=Prosthecobacter sp. TaxID=1965333 RepID=UPI0039004D7F
MKPLLFSSLFLLGCSSLAFAAGKEIEGERAPAATVCPSPEDARAKMSVPDGYEVRCFAHEPMIVNPVAMTWDHRGRLWVVEGYEYPNGSAFKGNAFGIEAKDDKYHTVPPQCRGQSEISNLKSQIPRDRVIILEDTDNNGEADKRTVFVEGLDMGSAILCGDGGIYVGQQPHLLHFKDTDGDDHADEWRVVLTGFGREDTHELLNSFCWGPDGWLYMTHGVFTNSKVRRPGQKESEGFKFDAGIGRARPVGQASSLSSSASGILPETAQPGKMPGTPEAGRMPALPWEFEVFADGTSNPWGCDYDAAGNFFVSACVIDHFFHMAPGGIYVRQGGAPENPYAYELLPSIVKHKHFRAAYAGVQIYQGGRYPADTHGHAFIGNIHDNAIHEEVLTPVGATFKCEPRRDFLRANDGWFRPVSTQTGPDGFLWIMDWCDKYPCYQNAKANPEGVDRERGRIWRVVTTQSGSVVPASAGSETAPPKGGTTEYASRPTKDLDLKKLSTADLVKTLEHPNNWMRRMARRMLVEKEHSEALQTELQSLILNSTSLSTRLEALWSLHQVESGPEPLDANILGEVGGDREPTMRVWAARLSGERFRLADRHIASIADENTKDNSAKENDSLALLWQHTERLDKLSSDPDITVRLACAISRQMTASSALTLTRPLHLEDKIFRAKVRTHIQLNDLIQSSAKDADGMLSYMIWRAIEPGISDFANAPETLEILGSAAPTTQPLSRVLSHKAMRRLCDTRKAENLDLAVEFCDKIAAHDILLAHALDGLVKGQEGGVIKPVKDVSVSLAKWRSSANADVRNHAQTLAVLWGDEVAVKEMIVALHDASKPEKDRIAVLQSLRKVKTDAVKEGLKPLLAPGTSTTLGVAAIRAAADLGGDDFVLPLISQAASKDFNVRNAAMEALSSRPYWTRVLLKGIADGSVPSTGFPAPVRRALATNKDKDLRGLAFKVLGAWQDSSDDVKALIAAKKQACLTGDPDLANGKLIFTSTCMVCHEFHGGGQKVGPDLIGSGRSNLDAILANVIDPNQIIGNGYENFTVATKDGRTLAGRVVEDTPGHVKLLGAGGVAQVVPRDQIASLTNSKQSLMPMGFGALPDAMFRDLIWYILAPPEEGPLTPAKKDLLIKGVEVADAPAKPKGYNSRAIDWESVSLWNPEWKVNGPDFERSPVKLGEYYSKTNVLLMHPFPDKKTPASFERKLKVEKTKLKFSVAADDRGDWIVKAVVNGQVVKEMAVDHEKPRWKDIEIDLSKFAGREITVRLEAHASGWNMEFGYWHGIMLE